MSDVLLSKIEDVFDVTGRGIIIAPGFPIAAYRFSREYDALIKHGGGTRMCKATFSVPFQSPPPKEVSYYCHLSGIAKAEIPIGSELWLVGVENDEIHP